MYLHRVVALDLAFLFFPFALAGLSCCPKLQAISFVGSLALLMLCPNNKLSSLGSVVELVVIEMLLQKRSIRLYQILSSLFFQCYSVCRKRILRA